MAGYVMALDEGTTSCRSILFDQSGAEVAVCQREFRQYFPESGWVEHDAEEIWEAQLATMEGVLEKAGIGVEALSAIGITNQRETVVVWDRKTGRPVCNAIVWQDRRTSDVCKQMRDAGLEKALMTMTGLRIDPYFSATKVQWILDHVDGVRDRAERGDLCMGTIDSWLVWNLTEGDVHVTDASNASRTLLYNLHSGAWDPDLLEEFGVPESMLPEVVDSSGVVGEWRGVPISGMIGDQQAALFGQGCFEAGMAKNTYGTGCFLLMNTGERAVMSENQLLSTVAWQIDGKREFALEGSVFMAGALFQWFRDGLELVKDVHEFDELARSVDDAGGVVMVPAFAGLGAPHWDPYARGALMGLSRGTTKAHVCRAAMEAVSFQAVELLECMERDAGMKMSELRVDGGASRSDLLMQIQADLMQRVVVRPEVVETTAFGAAALAGLGVGFWEDKKEIAKVWSEDRRFEATIDRERHEKMRGDWDWAVKAVMR